MAFVLKAILASSFNPHKKKEKKTKQFQSQIGLQTLNQLLTSCTKNFKPLFHTRQYYYTVFISTSSSYCHTQNIPSCQLQVRLHRRVRHRLGRGEAAAQPVLWRCYPPDYHLSPLQAGDQVR